MMIVFRGLKGSKALRDEIQDKIEYLAKKFPFIHLANARAVVSMENSPWKPGRDAYGFKVIVPRTGHTPMVIEKKSMELSHAISEVLDGILESGRRGQEKAGFKATSRIAKLKRRLVA
ncbi:MAG: hypothetical protein WCI18_04355 [Pseudomonadota bacterium]